MFVFVGFLIGAAIGGLIAYRRKGRTLDILHYTVAYGMIFSIIALFVNILILRAG